MGNIKLSEGEKLFTECRTATFRKEKFNYIHTGIIDSRGETWTTTELDEANLNQVYNQYRLKYGIPFPDEVIALRKHYGLSAAKMSLILGFGANQYRLYESGEIPSASNARILVAIRDKRTFLDFLDASRELVGEKEYDKIKGHVSALDDYTVRSSQPNGMNGYVSLSLPKAAAAVEYFVKNMGPVFVTKMNKLLFYADFLCYRRKGFGLTGLEYKAMPFGPVPCGWGRLYDSMPRVQLNEHVFPDMTSGIQLSADSEPDMKLFDETETDVLREISGQFRRTNAGEISKISHEEAGWIENHELRKTIDYSYAFSLSLQ